MREPEPGQPYWPWLGIQYKQQAKFDPADYDVVPTATAAAG
ncbi:hypothetical protein [Nocardioides speluncae]|nr:hypothetical protein [Nocardioides speluncae]